MSVVEATIEQRPLGDGLVLRTATAADATAKTDLALEVVGQPRLSIAGREGLVSARAEAGQQSTVAVVVTNDGSAPAEDVSPYGASGTG